MARIRPSAEEARQALLAAAEAFVAVRADAMVIVTTGRVEVIRRAAAGPAPEGMNPYDRAILAVLTEAPQSSRRLARAAGHTFNSYFRERLGGLVEEGRIRRTRRGYSEPPAR